LKGVKGGPGAQRGRRERRSFLLSRVKRIGPERNRRVCRKKKTLSDGKKARGKEGGYQEENGLSIPGWREDRLLLFGGERSQENTSRKFQTHKRADVSLLLKRGGKGKKTIADARLHEKKGGRQRKRKIPWKTRQIYGRNELKTIP